MASAIVGFAIISCQCSTGSWLVTSVERRPWRSSRISRRSWLCSLASDFNPQSSIISKRVLESVFKILSYLPSAFAIPRSCSSRGNRKYRVEWPRWQALCARAQARYVLPTPVGPMIRVFRASLIHWQSASCMNRDLSRPRLCRKSTSSTQACWRNLAFVSRVLKRRFSRSVISRSTSNPMRSSKLSWSISGVCICSSKAVRIPKNRRDCNLSIMGWTSIV